MKYLVVENFIKIIYDQVQNLETLNIFAVIIKFDLNKDLCTHVSLRRID